MNLDIPRIINTIQIPSHRVWNIYLYGSLLQAEPYLKNDARIPIWKTGLDFGLAELQKSDKKYRWSGSSMRMRIA